jgi:putative redox protein
MLYKFEKPISGSIGTLKYQCNIEWRNGKIVADEPASNGGGDKGPDPFSLLLSSVAACSLVTLRMYIDRKGWTIDEIGVNVNMWELKKEEKTVTVIDRDLRILQPLTEEQRNRLTDIARSCPISRALEGEIQLRTYLYNDSSTEKQVKYTNGEVTVVWKPDFCRHSGRCVMQLPGVFNTHVHPWVNMQGASTEAIVHQVQQCPTGALSFLRNSDGPPEAADPPHP